jgi:hypothetical protein
MEKNIYKFSNLIQKERFDKFDKLDKLNFLYRSRIYVDVLTFDQEAKELYKRAFRKMYNCDNDEENFKKYRLENKYSALTCIHSEVQNEICERVVESKMYWNNESNSIISIIKIDLENSLDIRKKEEIINQEYNKYLDLLKKCEDYYHYFSCKTRYENDKKIFKNVSDKFYYGKYLKLPHKAVIEYITHPIILDPEKYKVFKKWKKIETYITIIDFLKNENLLEPSTTNQKKEKYYSPIFNGRKEENIFLELLEEFNAIDNNNNFRNRKFQPICNALFNINIDDKELIFKSNAELKDYIKFLKLKFPDSIKSDNRLSDGDCHLEMIERNQIYLKLLKRLKTDKIISE